jgi:hypothetical protein
VVESATANKIHEDPAFARWDPFNTKGGNRFTSREKNKDWQYTNNYGIAMPKRVKPITVFPSSITYSSVVSRGLTCTLFFRIE